MKTKITLMAAIPALLLAVVGYAQDYPATHPMELDAVTKTWKVTAVDARVIGCQHFKFHCPYCVALYETDTKSIAQDLDRSCAWLAGTPCMKRAVGR